MPIFVLGLLASVIFALWLVMFRGTRVDFWGVVACVVMMSISSLFYIIVGQYLFSRVARLAPISGYAGGLDAVRFLVLPICLMLVASLAGQARFFRTLFLEEAGKDYVRTARAKGLAETAVMGRHQAAQRHAAHHHQFGQCLAGAVHGRTADRELLRYSGPGFVHD